MQISNTPLTRIFTPLALAALTGCASVIPVKDLDKCTTREEIQANASLAFFAGYRKGDTYSNACSEGRAGAVATLTGRKSNGELHYPSVLLGLEFDKIVSEKIQSGTDEIKVYYTEVRDYFNQFLKRFGGITLSDLQKSAASHEKKLADEAAELQRQLEIQREAAAARQVIPACVGEGVFRSCGLK